MHPEFQILIIFLSTIKKNPHKKKPRHLSLLHAQKMERTEVAVCISKKELSTTKAIQSLSCSRKRHYTNNNPKMTIL